MAEIRWGFSDPVVNNVDIAPDKQGYWVIKLKVQEKNPGSLPKKVVRVKLIDLGKFFDKQLAIETWDPSQGRKPNTRAETTLKLNTGRKEYPDRVKIVFEKD